MKKYLASILSLVLALAMVFTLVACGDNSSDDDDDDDDSSSKKSSSSQSSDESDDESSEPSSEEDDTSSKTSKPAKEDNDEDEEENEEETTFSRGIIEGNTYTNNFLGIQFTKPSDWEFSSDDEIMSMLDATGMYDKIEDILDAGIGIYDVVAKDSDGNSVMIGAVNLEAVGQVNMDEQDYIESVVPALESMGFTFGDVSNVKLGSQKYLSALGSITYGNISINQSYYVKKINNYMTFIIITSTDDAAYIEDMFS